MRGRAISGALFRGGKGSYSKGITQLATRLKKPSLKKA
jgi:hypothetical protein